MVQECEVSGRSGLGVRVKQEVRQECDGISRKWERSVRGSAGSLVEV